MTDNELTPVEHSCFGAVFCGQTRAAARAACAACNEPATPARCEKHPAYLPDYCPLCGTARVIGSSR